MTPAALSALQARLMPGLIYLAAFISCFPLIHGFPHGHDWIYELVRVAEYRHALEAGQYPPYWANNLYGGYGSPIFLFYAPLFAFVATLFASVVGSIAWGATLTLVFFSALSAFLVERMMRAVLQLDSASAATRVAAYLYALSPYLIGDKLLRNANAEFTALCIAPLAFWGLFALRRSPRRGQILLAAGIGLTILAHNLSALTLVALVLFFSVLLYARRGELTRLGYAAAGIALGVLVATFFWLPALSLQPLVQLEQMTQGRFDFHQNFPPLASLFSYEFYSLGVWALILLLAAPLVLWWRKSHIKGRPWLAFGVLGAALALLMLQTPSTAWIWERIPLLPLFQFPWRLMGPVALLIALMGALSFQYATQPWNGRAIAIVEILVLLACFGNALPSLLHYEPLTVDVSAKLQPQLSAAAIRTTNAPATVLDEYLPQGANPSTPVNFRAGAGPVLSSHPPVNLRALIDTAETTTIEITASEPAVIHLARWAFPVWSVMLNSAPVNYTVGRLHNVDVAVPAGRSELILSKQPPRIRIIGLWFSLGGVALWLWLLIRMQRGAKK